MGTYVDHIGWASVTPPATTPSNLRWWNRALVLAEQRKIYSSHPLGWAAAVLADIQREGDMPTYSMRFSQKEVGSKVSISINGIYLGTFTWRAPTAPKPCAKEGQLQDPLIDSGCCPGLVRDPAGICRKPAPPPRECEVGFTKCIGEDLYWCRDGVWTLQQYGAPKCKAIPTPPPPEPTCRKEGEKVTFPYVIRCCKGLVQDFWGVCRTPLPIPPEPVPPEPVPPPEECPRGTIYTRGLFEECDVGYYQGDLPGAGLIGKGMACICAKGYEPPTDEVPDISSLIPLLIIAAVILVAVGLFKR